MSDNKMFEYQQFFCEENAYRMLAKVKVMQSLYKASGRDTMKGWSCEESYALFVSSYTCPVEKQPTRSWPESMLPIAVKERSVDASVKSAMVWDYHCICAVKMRPLPTDADKEPKASWWIYDPDTQISAPMDSPFGKHCIPMEYYFTSSFMEWTDRKVPEPHTCEEFTEHTKEKLRVRVVPAEDFLNGFSSDRSHMMNLMQPKDKDGKTNWLSAPPSWPLIQKQQGVTMNLAWYINMSNVKDAHKTDAGKKLAPAGVVLKVEEVCPYLMGN